MLDARGTAVPRIAHWGADLGDVDPGLLDHVVSDPAIAPSSPDMPLRPSILAGPAEGWSGFPAILAHRIGAGPARLPLRIRRTGLTRPDPHSVVVELGIDDDRGPLLSVGWRATLSPEGVVTVDLEATAEAREGVGLHRLAACIPVPARASELLDFSGVWGNERRPQRGAVRDGLLLREQRHGRPGHDSPYLMVLGTPGFGFRSGEVWALHHAWSGNSTTGVDSLATGHRRLLAAELLDAGELSLASGERYRAPQTVLAFSDHGLDGLSDRLHPFVRALTPPAGRPVVLNTWEAVYYDQDLETLLPLVERAAEAGVERFVLDDGWFTGRTDDRRSLGDWTVDPHRWPDGLGPLLDAVTARGMDFGLWVEPEMVSADSQLAREHPDWMLADPSNAGVPPSWRHQHTLDLTIAAAHDHVLAVLTALLTEYPIAFLKWDHNRDHHAGSSAAHTRALYAILDELRTRFPALAIESCASGGARMDLGIARRVHRFWTSDTNDALDRQRIQRFSGLLLPPELLGGHVGAPRAHITGRTHDLSFRLATALFGSAGIEWDLTTASDADLERVRAWIDTVKRFRPLVTSGRTVRSDEVDDSRYVHGLMSPLRDEALIALVTLDTSPVSVPPPLRFPGLDRDRRYRVEPLDLGDPLPALGEPPAWLIAGGITVTGGLLADLGLPVPLLPPEQALLLHARAVA